MKEESKATKKRRILKQLLKLVLFLVVAGCLYFQLKSLKWQEFGHFRIQNWLFLILAFVLVVLNQGIEWIKWKRFASHIVKDNRIIRQSFLAGLASGFVSPNGWGNVLGRMIYFRKRDAMGIVLSTALGNLSQLLPTVFFGALAFSVPHRFNWTFSVLSWLLFTALFTGYYFSDLLLKGKKFRSKLLRHLLLMLHRFGYLRTELLALSTFRFLVFTAQFVLLFMAVGYQNYLQLTISVWLIYALTSFIPSLWSGKILIRESAALFVFSGTAVLASDIIVVCLLIWVINIALPALIGSFAWFPIKRKLK